MEESYSDNIETIFDNDAQTLANWISSDPKVNGELFLQACKLYNSKHLPIRLRIQERDNDIYFFNDDTQIHCFCITRPSGCYGYTPEELMEKWSNPNNYNLPTIFSSEWFIHLLRDLKFFDVNQFQSLIKGIKRSNKIDDIGI